MDIRGWIVGGLVIGSVAWVGCIDEDPYFWDAGTTRWPLVGSYELAADASPLSLDIESSQFTETKQYVDSEKEMTVTLSSLGPCGFLSNPSESSTPRPSTTPSPTMPEDETLI